jgi:hypothetical protein
MKHVKIKDYRWFGYYDKTCPERVERTYSEELLQLYRELLEIEEYQPEMKRMEVEALI